jgi:pSer/pThr/pTyr-binding forkhead associated (FHA) protein
MSRQRINTLSMNQLAEQLRQWGQEKFARQYPNPFLVLVFEPPEEDDFDDDSTVQTKQTDLSQLQGQAAEPTGKRVIAIAQGRLPKEGERLVVGRQAGCEIIIDARKVSREHAAFIFRNGRWYVEDLGSANGTRINGSRLPPSSPHALKSGDMLAFWQYLFQFVEPPAFLALLQSSR